MLEVVYEEGKIRRRAVRTGPANRVFQRALVQPALIPPTHPRLGTYALSPAITLSLPLPAADCLLLVPVLEAIAVHLCIPSSEMYSYIWGQVLLRCIVSGEFLVFIDGRDSRSQAHCTSAQEM